MRNGNKVLMALEDYWHGRRLSVGTEFTDSIKTDDLDVEVTIRVRRRAAPDAVAGYRDGALAYLATRLHEAHHCGCSVTRKGGWSKYSDSCKAKIVAAVVYRWTRYDPAPRGEVHAKLTDETGYKFVCGRHRDKHNVDPRKVLAVVELPSGPLDDLKKRAEAEHREWLKKVNEEENQRRAEEEARRCTSVGPRGGRCIDDTAHAGPHQRGMERWTDPLVVLDGGKPSAGST